MAAGYDEEPSVSPSWEHGRVSEQQKQADNRARATTEEFRAFVREGWAPRRPTVSGPSPSAAPAAARRAVLSAAYPRQRLIIPAGGLKVRSNDTDYVFRPHTAFAWLTGLGADREPDAVLVLEPVVGADGAADGHEAVLYFRPLADRDSDEFFADSRYGEFWVGARPTIADVELELGMAARHIDEFAAAAAKDAGEVTVRLVRDADLALTAALDAARVENGAEQEGLQESDDALAHEISHLRMCKDDYEIEQMREAVEATHHGFDAMVAELATAAESGRGERWLEGVFALHARHRGNGVGYDSICAAGDHANTLHWIKNTGEVREGDLVLIDAGVEVDSLFTADITRTFPVSGTFTDAQREIYDAVFAAQEAGIAAVQARQRSSPTSTRRRSGSSPSTCTPGACSPTGSRSRTPSTRTTGSTTGAGWCTARPTTWGSTSTTARSRPARSTWMPSCGRAWSSPSSPGSTSSPTTCWPPSASAAPGCASRTTSWSRPTAARTCRQGCRAARPTSRPGSPACAP